MVTSAQEPVMAPEQEQSQIQQLDDFYRGFAPQAMGAVRLISPSGREFVLPRTVIQLLAQVVHVLAQGEAVSIVPTHKELTTQEAADLLNVSRQYLVRLLERGEIPHFKVGTHRRVAFGNLIEYKTRRDRDRQQGFAELAQLSQELGLYA